MARRHPAAQTSPSMHTRVLIVDQDPAARLTLQTVLQAGGYRVDAASSAAEALDKMEDSEYALILSELQLEQPDAGLQVIAHARMMEYQPATAIVKTFLDSRPAGPDEPILVEPEDLPELLGQVASLIQQRATKKVEKLLHARRN